MYNVSFACASDPSGPPKDFDHKKYQKSAIRFVQVVFLKVWQFLRLYETKSAVDMFPLFLPMCPRAPQLNPNLPSPPKHINGDWVRVWLEGTMVVAMLF